MAHTETEGPLWLWLNCFRDAGHKILYDKWKAKEILSDKSAIIDMAAAFIRDDIRTSIQLFRISYSR